MDLINQFIENYKKSLPFMKIWDEFPVHSCRTRYNLPVSVPWLLTGSKIQDV